MAAMQRKLIKSLTLNRLQAVDPGFTPEHRGAAQGRSRQAVKKVIMDKKHLAGVGTVDPAGEAALGLKSLEEIAHLSGQLAVQLAIAGAQRRIGESQRVGHHLPPQALIQMHQRMVDIDFEQTADGLYGIGRRRLSPNG
jgi:hypothetical protein